MRVLLDLADTRAPEENYFNHLTGFNSYTRLQRVLKFVLPVAEKKNISYWKRKLPKTKVLIPPCYLIQMKNLHKAMAVIQTQTRNHILAKENEFLSVVMKLRLGI